MQAKESAALTKSAERVGADGDFHATNVVQ
jgi:hypothetical protein